MALNRRTLWSSSLASSLILLGLVLAQVDWSVARALVTHIDYVWIAAGLALLLIEGLITAARFRLLAGSPVTYGNCLLTTAWYVLMLIALPARLGEIAGIGLMVRYMRERAGMAAASLLFQRLFDMIALAMLLAVVCVLAFTGTHTTLLASITGALVAVLVALMIFLEHVLAAAARPLLPRRGEKWPRRGLRLVLQARMFRRHHLDRARTWRLGGYTLLKWFVNLTAIGCVVIAVVPDLTRFAALGVGIVYNLAAVIPVHTVGGFGVSEVVLVGSFSWLGYSLDVGAPIAIAIRLALISAPILFWLLTIASVSRARDSSD